MILPQLALVAIPAAPYVVYKIFTLPPKITRMKDLDGTLNYHHRINRKGVENKKSLAYAWVPRKK